jgi:hypothetical protein
MASGSVGVFGQGGNADRKSVTVNNVPGTAGPKDPGVGVLGIGGTQSDDGKVHGPGGPGVMGVAGGASMPSSDDTASAGVYGVGSAGTDRMPPGRGGVFASASIAQIRLVPTLNPATEVPKVGNFGDLYVSVTGDISGGTASTSMYLCISPGDGVTGTAQWTMFQASGTFQAPL